MLRIDREGGTDSEATTRHTDTAHRQQEIDRLDTHTTDYKHTSNYRPQTDGENREKWRIQI